MRKKRAWIWLTLCIAAAVCLALSLTLNAKTADDENAGWTPDEGWTMEGGVYTKNDIGAVSLITYGAETTFSEISADIKLNETWTTDIDANVGIKILLKSNAYWYIDYASSPMKNSVRIRYYDASGTEYWAAYNTNTVAVDVDTYFQFKIVRTDATLTAYINDTQIVAFTSSDGAGSFDNAAISLSSWGNKPSVKNLTVTTAGETEQKVWQPTSHWTTSEEDGETVYTKTGDPGAIPTAKITYLGEVDFNTVQADFRINEYWQGRGNFSFYITYGSGGEDFIMIDPYNSLVSVTSDGTTVAEAGFTCETNRWYAAKIYLQDNYLELLIDGVSVVKYAHKATEARAVADATVGFNSWGNLPSVKNIATANEEIDLSDSGYLDFEFSDSLAVASFKAENAALSFADGKMKMTVSRAGAVLISPTIDVPKGTLYSMRLSVRNTIVVRMKNATSATSVTLSFITEEDGTYDEVKKKSFEILPNSDFVTYYFNLSDVADCGHWTDGNQLARCNDYLSAFRLAFDGAESGEVEIDAITFEREKRVYENAAESLTCIADPQENTVTVYGRLLPKYAGGLVNIWQMPIENYNELLSYSGNKLLTSVKSDSDTGAFSVTFPLKDASAATHIPSRFLAGVDGVKLDDSFTVENWRDLSDGNPYAFELPALTVNVCDSLFGACGDGFTNDNQAIQAAIDYVAAQGGGTVVLPGDDSTYGRRYIASQLNLQSNVELRIEKGAVLWQSSRYEDYDYGEYAPVYGHDVTIDGVAWTHAAPCWNLPLLYVKDSDHVKITGGGTVRMCDTGTEWLDGNSYAWDSDITANCGSFIHIQPIGIWNSSDIEITDITISRGANWHLCAENSSNIYIGNVNITEVSCINGDGFSFGVGSHHVVVDRCFLYSNDDALVICSGYNDPRGYGHAWWQSLPDGENSVHDITLVNSNLFGGHGVTFIPWGSANPAAEKSEIYSITVRNNVLGGTSTAVGVWTDNPYYGDSGLNTYDQCEKDDYSPMRDIVIVDNVYTAPTLMGTWDGNPPEIAAVTNTITDCGIFSSSAFVNGSFDRSLRYPGEVNWTSGLTYWSRSLGTNGEVGTEAIGTKSAVVKSTGAAVTQADYAGYIKGEGELYQGLYEIFGTYQLSIDVKLLGGSAKMFARNAATGEILASKDLLASEDFRTETLQFTLAKGMTVQLGISHSGEEADIVYLDNATVQADNAKDIYAIEGETIAIGFDDFDVIPNTGVRITDGKLITDNRAEYKIILKNNGSLDTFEFRTDIYFSVNGKTNAGVYLFASDASTAQDCINAYNIQIETASEDASTYAISMYLFKNKYEGQLTRKEGLAINGDYMTLRIVAKQNTIFVFVGNDEVPVMFYEVPDGTSGNIGFRSQRAESTFANLSLVTAQYVDPDEEEKNHELEEAVREAKASLMRSVETGKSYSASNYTEESYAVLQRALTEAEAVLSRSDATKEECEAALVNLQSAIQSLQFNKQTPGRKNYTIGIICGSIGSAVLIAGVVLFIVIRKRRMV